MNWNKPRTAWQWLILLSPGAVSVVFTAIAHSSEGDASGTAMMGFPVAILMCIVLAGYMVRGPETPGKKIGMGCLFTVLLLIVNLSIAFGGCALLPVRFDMR